MFDYDSCLMVQAPAAEEPDVSAFSQMLTPSPAAQHDGASAPEPGAEVSEGNGRVGGSEHGRGGEPARHTSTADVLDYREGLTGCADVLASSRLQVSSHVVLDLTRVVALGTPWSRSCSAGQVLVDGSCPPLHFGASCNKSTPY